METERETPYIVEYKRIAYTTAGKSTPWHRGMIRTFDAKAFLDVCDCNGMTQIKLRTKNGKIRIVYALDSRQALIDRIVKVLIGRR